MRTGYVASSMLVVLVLLATMLTVSPASGQANGMKKVILPKQNPLDRLQANPASVNQVSDSVTNLAQKIARSIASPKSKSEIFSPVSIAGALSLLLLGAGGQTQRELLNVMGFGEGTAKLSFQEIHYAFGRLFQDLVANDPSLVPLVTWRVNDKCNRYDEDYEDDDFPPANTTANTSPSHLISVVNGMFLQNGLKPATRLLTVMQKFYQSSVKNLDFERDPSSAAAQINDWCARETNGKIREMVTAQMVANSRMIVASALYFKAQWETTFSPYGTRPRPFYLNGRQEPPIDVETMATTGCFPYYDATPYGAQIIGLPYETGISTMYIVVSNNSTRQELQRLQTNLGAAQLNWMIDQMKTKKGMVVLPKLSISNRIQLSSILQQLGVRDLFDPSRSNLSQVLDETVPQTGTQQFTSIPQAPPKPVNQVVGSRFDSPTSTAMAGNSVAPGERPTNKPPTLPSKAQVHHQPQQTPHTQQKPSSQQPLTTVRPQPQKQQHAPPANTNLQRLTLDWDPSDCNQVENCRYSDKCVCTLLPTTEDAAGCGTQVASFTRDPNRTDCQFSLENKQLGRMSLCIKRSYQVEERLKNNQYACQQSGCIFFKQKCYCCQGNAQLSSYKQVAQTAQPAGVYGFDGKVGTSPSWVPVVRYNEYAPNSGRREICQNVPTLNNEQLCYPYRYRWIPDYGVCIDEATCRDEYQRTKRQAPYPSMPYARESQQYKQGVLSEQQRLQQQYQQAQQQEQARQPGQQGKISNPVQQPQQPNGKQQQTNVQTQQQPSSPLPPRQSGAPLFVNEIITQVKLDVNEQGTEGGAVTLALIDRIGPGYTFQVDSPFLILIRHDITKALLFYGSVYDPRP